MPLSLTALASGSAHRPAWGLHWARAPSTGGGGASFAQLSPCPAPPPGHRDAGVALEAPVHPRLSSPELGGSAVTFAHYSTRLPQDLGLRVGKRNGGVPSWNGGATGVQHFLPPPPASPRSTRRRAVTASGGTWDQVHRSEAGAAVVGEGPSPGRPNLARPRFCALLGTSAARGSCLAASCRFCRANQSDPRPCWSPSLLRCASPGPRVHTEPRLFSPGAVSLVT